VSSVFPWGFHLLPMLERMAVRREFAQLKLIQSNQLSMELGDPNKVYTQTQIKCKLIVKN
jgi:hypothetical protein